MEEEQIEFKIPFIPPSVNSLYNVMFSLKKVELKPEIRLFKSNVKQYVPYFKVIQNEKLSCEIEVIQNWYFKNGNTKKQDIQNMVKCLLDAISERLGFGDEQFFEVLCKKKHDESKQETKIKIRRISNA